MPNSIKDQLIEKIKKNEWKTPFYFYDLNTVRSNYKELKDCFGDKFQLFYSMKSNPHEKILETLLDAGGLIDVSSHGEMSKAFEAGFSGKQMSFVGPGKSVKELELCIDHAIEYTIIESFQELEIFSALAHEKKKTPKFCLRIAPEEYFHTNGQKRVHSPTHFGISESEVMDFKKFIKDNNHIVFSGLHFYIQSQYLKAEVLLENFTHFLKISKTLQNHFGIEFEMINLGGGFGIPYFEGQEELNLSELKMKLESLPLSEFPQSKFFIESGRFISGSAGSFITQVLYTKKSYDKSYVICDGGMTQHQSAIGIGQVIRRNFPMEIIQLGVRLPSAKFSIAGPSCYSIDLLATDVTLPAPAPGDYVIIGQSGAYGPSFSPENFLSRPKAFEYTNEQL